MYYLSLFSTEMLSWYFYICFTDHHKTGYTWCGVSLFQISESIFQWMSSKLPATLSSCEWNAQHLSVLNDFSEANNDWHCRSISFSRKWWMRGKRTQTPCVASSSFFLVPRTYLGSWVWFASTFLHLSRFCSTPFPELVCQNPCQQVAKLQHCEDTCSEEQSHLTANIACEM